MFTKSHSGYILIYTLVIGSIIVAAMSGFLVWGIRYLKVSNHTLHEEQAARIAEAGINYYKWHLAHAPTDYTDGTGQPGPYVHDFTDKDGAVIGQFTLEITPPASGTQIVTVRSTGQSAIDPTANKTFTVQLTPQSVLHYAVLSHQPLFFPESSEIFGPVHSNGGIRFDGIAHNLVTSSRASYLDTTHGDTWDDDDDGDEENEDEDDEDTPDEDDDTDVICHIPPGNPGNRHTLTVGTNAVSAHLNHGDHAGPCDDDDDGHDDDGDDFDDDESEDDHHSGGEDNDNDGNDEDDTYQAQTGYEFGVHTHKSPVDPLVPAAVPVRADVFLAGRTFPVPSVDLDTLTNTLSELKTLADSPSGFYRGDSSEHGYKIVLKTNDTFDLYKVTQLVPAPTGCSGDGRLWDTWSVQATSSLGNFAFPSNGIIYFNDHVWVEGTITTARLTIVAAGDVTSTQRGRNNCGSRDGTDAQKNIIIGNNLRYNAYTGSESLALIAQANILVAMTAPTTLRIDSALIAKNGGVLHLAYRAPEGSNNRCSPYHTRTSITLWGMIAAYDGFSFSRTDGTGFGTQAIYYDGNLTISPPPGIPSLVPTYKIITTEER